MDPQASPRPRVFGIGLNKTGTKTLAHHLRQWGFRHRTYDSDNVHESPSFRLYQAGNVDALLDIAARYDSAEDWPWPLLYRELDERFPEARFVLTRRASVDAWYRSLCTMAVRIGPLPLYETAVYGSSMPHGRKAQHVEVYERHDAAVRAHFAGRPGKLLELTWGEGDEAEKLASFLGLEGVDVSPAHKNRSRERIYDGDSLAAAHLHRIVYQTLRGPGSLGARAAAAFRVRILGRSA